MGAAGNMDFTHVCEVYNHDSLRKRERERERERRQDETNSFFPRVVNKHANAFFHSALAQRGTNLLRIHTANTILHSLRTCTWSKESKC